MNSSKDSSMNIYDVIIIGGGPAGLTAALYLARARYRVLVLEKDHFGGQITITAEVVNFPGVARTSGTQLTDTMRRQAEDFGAEFLLTEALSVHLEGTIKHVQTGRGELSCFGILLATGAHPRMIGFQGEAQFKGRGVAYCATCDGEFFTGKEIFVIGGGFAAAEESVFLTKYATHVTILMITDDFTCAKATADATRAHEKISILTNTEVEEVAGDTFPNYLRYRNLTTGEVTEYHAADGDTFGVFVFAGYAPETDLVKDLINLDELGYIVTDSSCKTSADGVYAAGDVCIKPLRQVVTAVGDGALAATALEKVAAAAQAGTGIHPVLPDTIEKSDTAPLPDASLLDEAMLAQLSSVFTKMKQPLCLRLFLDDRPSSAELRSYMEELASLTDKLTLEVAGEADPLHAQDNTIHQPTPDLPCVGVYKKDGSYTGLAFHGVPGGHEFTSFILGLYNASGPGQSIDTQLIDAIAAIDKPIQLQVLVSLSCTMCPELVTAAQRIATLNPHITADVYDLNHYPDLKERYQVMSVPCLVINKEHVTFGKKSIEQILDHLQ